MALTAIKLDSSHKTIRDTELFPKGTVIFHYAVVGDDVKKYIECRSSLNREVQTGKYKGQPLLFTHKVLGDVLEVNITEEGDVEIK